MMMLKVDSGQLRPIDLSERVDTVNYYSGEGKMAVAVRFLTDRPTFFPQTVKGFTLELDAVAVMSCASLLLEHEHGLTPAEQVHVAVIRHKTLADALETVIRLQSTQTVSIAELQAAVVLCRRRVEGVSSVLHSARCSVDCILDLLHHNGLRWLYGLLRGLWRKLRKGGDDDINRSCPTSG